MLLSLHIKNFILIEKADIEFGPGFSVLTGETGAGKSIILDALQTVLGGKTSAKVLRSDEEPAVLCAEFDVRQHSAITSVLEGMGLPVEGGLIIRRTITKDGRSRSFINDAAVAVSTLQKISDSLLEIFGHDDRHGLMSPTMYRETLDAFAGLLLLKQEVAAGYKGWQEVQAQLEDMKALQARSATEQDYLQYVAAELEAFNYLPNEEEDLAQQRQKLLDYSKSQEVLNEANSIISGGSLVQQIHKLQKTLARKPDLFADVISGLERASLEMQEVQAQLSGFKSEYDQPEGRLSIIENRFFAIKSMAKKYAVAVDKLPSFLEEVKDKLYVLENIEQAIVKKSAECMAVYKAFEQVALTLCAKREESAKRLESIVCNELQSLHMEQASFFVRVVKDIENPSSHGYDKVYFDIKTNIDSKVDALHAVASGGETSRIMLALKVALADVKTVGTMIFDEIDSGIGGVVASGVGKKLAELGKGRQILAITHQPQIAAVAANQYHVRKQVVDGLTQVKITALYGQDRVNEVARMLAGGNISEQAQQAAVALLKE